jgi:hypothetical protein
MNLLQGDADLVQRQLAQQQAVQAAFEQAQQARAAALALAVPDPGLETGHESSGGDVLPSAADGVPSTPTQANGEANAEPAAGSEPVPAPERVSSERAPGSGPDLGE